MANDWLTPIHLDQKRWEQYETAQDKLGIFLRVKKFRTALIDNKWVENISNRIFNQTLANDRHTKQKTTD